MATAIILLGVVILLAHFLEGITGFGCTIMAMPFAILLVGLDVGRPVLTIDALILCFFVAVISYKTINWRVLGHIIVFMGIGLPIGILLYSYLPGPALKGILAIFMILVSIRGLLLSYNRMPVDFKFGNKTLNVFLFLGGIIHGAFTSGGPLVIIYGMEKLKDKTEFRGTLCAMWAIMNGVLVAQQFFSHQLTLKVTNTTLLTLPFLIAGLILGNWAHHKIQNAFFTKLVYAVLLVSSVFMFV